MIDLLVSKINQESVSFIISSRDKYPDDSLCSVDKKAKFSCKNTVCESCFTLEVLAHIFVAKVFFAT